MNNEQQVREALDKSAYKMAWGLAEACNMAMDAKAKADIETFLPALKKMQEEGYKAALASAPEAGKWMPLLEFVLCIADLGDEQISAMDLEFSNGYLKTIKSLAEHSLRKSGLK